MPDLIGIGSVIKAHGLTGAIKINIEGDLFRDEAYPAVIFIDTETRPVPYFIQSVERIAEFEAVMKLEDVNSKEDAELLESKKLYVEIKSKTGHDPGVIAKLVNAIGYEVIDEKQGPIGKIQDVLEMPMQRLLQIHYGDQEIMIPVTDEIILEINTKEKQVYVNIPDGLLDVYLT